MRFAAGAQAVAWITVKLAEFAFEKGQPKRYQAVESLIMRPSRRNTRAIAAYRKAGFAFYDPSLHQLPESVSSTGLDYSDAVVMVQTPAAQSGFAADATRRIFNAGFPPTPSLLGVAQR